MTGPTPEQARALWLDAERAAAPAQLVRCANGIAVHPAAGTNLVDAWRAGERVRRVLTALGPWSPEALAAAREAP